MHHWSHSVLSAPLPGNPFQCLMIITCIQTAVFSKLLWPWRSKSVFTYSSSDIYGRFFHIVDCDEYVHHQATFIIVNIAVSLKKTHGHFPLLHHLKVNRHQTRTLHSFPMTHMWFYRSQVDFCHVWPKKPDTHDQFFINEILISVNIKSIDTVGHNFSHVLKWLREKYL